jgi:DNA invertase Pin-like site-specific DNA recombinase
MSQALIVEEVELWDIYARISDDPGNDELGVKRQVREATAKIEGRGGRVHAVHIDNNTSAWKRVRNADGTYSKVPSPRPAWEATQRDIQSGAARNIMSREPSRLWRHWADLIPVCDFIETTGVNVETLYGGRLDVSNAGDRAKTRMFGVMSALESEIKSERLQSKMLELAEDGKFAGGARPFGFEADGIKPRPTEQAVIRAWAEGLIAGKSLRDLERETTLKSPRGNAWTFATIGQLLTSPRIAGLRQHQGEVIGRAVWAPIIDRELWDRVQAILSDPSRKHRAPVRSLLTDFAYARKDGKLYRMRGGRATNGTREPDGAYRRIYEAKPGGSVDALKLEEAVELAVLDRTDRTAFIKPSGNAKPVDTSAVEEAQAALDLIKARRESGELDLEDYLDLIPEYRQALKDAQAAVRESTPKALPPQAFAWLGKPGALRQYWPDMTPEERREALSYVLDRVEVESAPGKRFSADRLKFRFKA